MEYKIVRLSTNRFKIKGVVYKRVEGTNNCNKCSFFDGNRCLLVKNPYCIDNGKFYYIIPVEL